MRKAFTIVLMVILAVLPLMANGNSEKAVVEQAEPTSIKVWVSSGSEDGVYKKVFDNLEASLGITVVDEYYPKDELDQKLQVSPIVGDTPDLIVCDYLMVPSYYEAGLIKSIEDHISDSLKEDLIPSVVTETNFWNHYFFHMEKAGYDFYHQTETTSTPQMSSDLVEQPKENNEEKKENLSNRILFIFLLDHDRRIRSCKRRMV